MNDYREKQVTLDDLMKEIVSVKKTLDFEMAALKSQTKVSKFRKFKEWLSEKLHSENFHFFHYFMRSVMVILVLAIWGFVLLSRSCETDEARVQRFIETCTTACHSTGSEYTIWTASSSNMYSLDSCTCARPDHTLFTISRSGTEGPVVTSP